MKAFAPGRVELLGNHTDYNGGVVLSAALDLGVEVEGTTTADGEFRLRSSEVGGEVETAAIAKTGGWADYPLGVAWVLREAGFPVGGFEANYRSTLPVGSGLSSSAAIEVATALLLGKLFGFEMEGMELARLCRKAENEFVGVNCGLLDQATSVFGRAGHAVFLDCRTETVGTIPFPERLGLLIVNSGVRHELTGGEYNERREMCFEAARAMGVPALRDADEEMLEAAPMPEMARRRARHIIGENERVLRAAQALREGDARGFGSLLLLSHESSVTHFENSTPELDLLVELARRQPGVHGARLTGGGFGGSIVAVGERDALPDAGAAIADAYRRETGLEAGPLVCAPGDGALARAAA